jgi:hypothetical protein
MELFRIHGGEVTALTLRSGGSPYALLGTGLCETTPCPGIGSLPLS